MKGIVEFLGHLEEIVILIDNAPTRVYTKLPQQRYHPGQDLRDSSTGKGRVDILDNLTRKTPGYEPEFFDGAFPYDRLIVRNVYFMRFSINCISADRSPSRV